MKLKSLTIFTTIICWLSLSSSYAQDKMTLEELRQSMASQIPSEKIYDLAEKELPSMEMTTLDGTSISTADLRGKRTMINIWFSNCQPCIDEMPVLNEIQQSLNSSDYNFLAVTFEDSTTVADFLTRTDFHFTHVINARQIIDQLGVTFYPKTLIIDEDLKIIRIEKKIPSNSTPADIEAWKQSLIDTLVEG